MSDGNAAIDGMIASIRKAAAMAKTAAPSVARRVTGLLGEQVAAGTTPDGAAWQPTLEGKRPLQNAAAALDVAAVGTVILVRLSGPEVVHNRGTKKYPQRRILPKRGPLPAAWVAGIKAELNRAFQRAIKGGG